MKTICPEIALRGAGAEARNIVLGRGYRLLLCGGLALIAVASPAARAADATAADEAEAVRAAFIAYRNAYSAGDGRTAVKLVTRNTIDSYEPLKRLALTATAAEVKALPDAQMLSVLTIRHRIPSEKLLQATPEEILVTRISEGWDGAGIMTQLTIGEVIIEGERARGALILEGKPVPNGYYQFAREADGWKLDLAAMTPTQHGGIAAEAAGRGVSLEDYVSSLLQRRSGRQPDPSIWNPPSGATET